MQRAISSSSHREGRYETLPAYGWLSLVGRPFGKQPSRYAESWHSLRSDGIDRLAVGATLPSANRPIYVGWMVLAFPIGWTVSQAMLGLMFDGYHAHWSALPPDWQNLFIVLPTGPGDILVSKAIGH